MINSSRDRKGRRMFQAGGGSASAGGESAYFQQQQQLLYALDGVGMVDSAFAGVDGGAGGDLADSRCRALLYNLSVLKDKVRQLEPLVGGVHGPRMSSVSVTGACAVVQDIITAASSMMYAFQQLGLGASSSNAQGGGGVGHAKTDSAEEADDGGGAGCSDQQLGMMDHAAMEQWHPQHHGGYYIDSRPTTEAATASSASLMDMIIELDAAELLARYTHYCQVCGKGFKRDANLRMHMRAHGDEYKSKWALANPTKVVLSEDEAPSSAATEGGVAGAGEERKSKYSCPQEGCRWNRKHAKFQPLKSVICVKNHYKRSHCPKMYVCNRCNRKHFSVLSDLRTHEKHCGGDNRWLCSCGTTFSRKDKLAGHVSLFAGHQPVPVDVDAGAGRKGRKRTTSSELTAGTTGFGMS